jgi:protein TonB
MLAHAPTPMQRPHGPALAVSARAGRHSASSFSPSPSLASASSAPASVEAALADAVPVSLRPLDSPMRAMPYRQLREHRGTLVLKVGIDGAGRVRQAALGASSGDAVLDDYALSSVYAWRFAVPVGHAEGLAGEVTLRFTGDDDRLAELR